jgi:cytochrome c5
MKLALPVSVATLLVAAGVLASSPQETPPPKKVDKAEVARTMRCQLPEGKGKETVVRLCSDCHAARVVTSARKTQDEWLQTVETMADKGINASDDDFTTVIEYLSAHLAPANGSTSETPKKDAPESGTKPDDCPKQPETAPPAAQHNR